MNLTAGVSKQIELSDVNPAGAIKEANADFFSKP